MADNVELNFMSGGDKVAAEEISTIKHQLIKIEFGPNGTATKVSDTDPLPSKATPISTFDHFGKAIGTTAVQLITGSTALKRGAFVKAALANTGIIYVGNSDVTKGDTVATDGFELSAGEAIFVDVDNLNKLYAIATEASQKVYVFYA